MAATTPYIGQPVSRVEGRAKVTGEAKYAAEYALADLAYGFVLSSPITKGRIVSIDPSDALDLEGVWQVFTHKNAPRLARSARSYRDDVAPAGAHFRPLHDAKILFNGQPIALVVAKSFELARYAATLVRVAYKEEAHTTELRRHLGESSLPAEGKADYIPPASRGWAQEAFGAAAVKLQAEYVTPIEHHNPIEPFAATALWQEDGTLTVYDKTQGVDNVQGYLCRVFGCDPDQVRVLSPYVGGAFGAGLRPQYHVFLAAVAARELKRPVRVTLTRQQMFTFGHRPATWQRVALAASADGHLEAILHEAKAETSRFEKYTENVVTWSGLLYQCANVKLDYQLVPLDFYTPIDMRAPGAVWGVYALECAMDELAAELNLDPLELRLRNYAAEDQNAAKPFSSKALRACYQQGAERFGWAQRQPAPRSMRAGKRLRGWGLASAAWQADQTESAAKALLSWDGKLKVSSATADIGTGTYTIMTQIAAETLGLPLENVTFALGDTNFPAADVEGGSLTAGSVGSAVRNVCQAVQKRVFKLARELPDSPLAEALFAQVEFADGTVRLRRDPTLAVPISHAMRLGGVEAIEETLSLRPKGLKRKRYSRHSHAAVFAEVEVDEAFGTVRVTRVVEAVAAGRILNPQTARSQVLGSVVMGIGAALQEASVVDPARGRFVNPNLADYHVPVNADLRHVEVLFVEEHDEVVNPLGVKGVGEIGLIGVAAAVANAVYHATGKRVRDLPITLEKLL